MNSQPCSRIAVVGGTASAWMVATALCSLVPVQHQSVMIFSACSSPRRELQSSLPSLSEFFRLIDIDAKQLFGGTHLVPRLGTCFSRGESAEEDFYHVFGDYGAPRGFLEFHYLLARLKAEDVLPTLNISSLALSAMAAKNNRFAPPVADKRSIFSTYDYGYSFATSTFIDLLKIQSANKGVIHREDPVEEIMFGGDSANGLRLTTGEEIGFDLIVDCSVSNDESLKLKAGDWLDWQNELVSNRVVEILGVGTKSLLAAKVFCKYGGWIKQQNIGKLSSFELSVCADDEASIADIRAVPEALTATSINCYNLSQGAWTNPWTKGIIKIGSAAANIQSPFVSEVDIAWVGIKALCERYPGRDTSQAVIENYNATVVETYKNIKDVTRMALQYFSRSDSFLWKKLNDAPMSEQLAYKLELFRDRGKLPFFGNESIKTNWQVWLLLGLGVWPQRIEHLAAQQPLKEQELVVRAAMNAVAQAVASMPEFMD